MPRWKSLEKKDSFVASNKEHQFLLEKAGRGTWSLHIDNQLFCTVRGKDDANHVISKKLYNHAGFCDALDDNKCTCGYKKRKKRKEKKNED